MAGGAGKASMPEPHSVGTASDACTIGDSEQRGMDGPPRQDPPSENRRCTQALELFEFVIERLLVDPQEHRSLAFATSALPKGLRNQPALDLAGDFPHRLWE